MLKPVAAFVQLPAFIAGQRVRITDEHKRQLKAAKLYSERDDGGVGVIRRMVTANVASIDFPTARYPGRLLHIVNIEPA